MILDIDNEKRRISLGLKQTKPNPWIEFANKYGIGDSVEGQIKSITDFGIFVGFPFLLTTLPLISTFSTLFGGRFLIFFVSIAPPFPSIGGSLSFSSAAGPGPKEVFCFSPLSDNEILRSVISVFPEGQALMMTVALPFFLFEIFR